MNNLSNFEFNGNQVRVLMIDGEPWFVAKDVSTVFDYSDPARMIQLVDDEDKNIINPHQLDSTKIVESFGSNTFRLSIINESGLYAVIFGSRKPEAKAFKKWVTSEVLPQIRKIGKYEIPNNPIKSNLPPQDIRVTNLVSSLKELEIDITNPRYKQHIQDLVLNKIISVNIQPQLPAQSTEQWLGAVEKAEELGYNLNLINRYRSALGRFVATHPELESRQEKRLCNGKMRNIYLYKDCDELEDVIKEYMDTKVLAG